MVGGSGKRVLLTGAGGIVGTVLRRALRGRYELRLLSRQRLTDPPRKREELVLADVADYDELRPALEGVDAIVHLAASARPESTWEQVLPANIIGTYNVFEAARDAGVGRVVFASSTHAMGMYYRDARPLAYDLPPRRRIGDKDEVRPDSFYGLSKVFGEALGRFYHEEHAMAVICIRIGFVTPTPDGRFRPMRDMARTGDPELMAGAIWLSHRDCAQLFTRALEADTAWAVVYGTSDNPRQVWDLTSARRLLGYAPQDRAPD